MNKDEALHKALKVLNCLNNDRVYETAWVKGAINACEEALAQPQPKLFLDLSNSNGNHPVQQEPFGYFTALPFGWTDCGKDDEGAIALYEHPAPSWQGLTAKEIASIPLNEYTVQTVERMLKEKNT